MMLPRVLQGRSADAPLVIAPGRTLDAVSIQSALSDPNHAWTGLWSAMAGRRVAVQLREPADAVLALLLAADQAARLLLIPADTPVERAAGFVDRAGTELLVTDADSVLPSPAGRGLRWSWGSPTSQWSESSVSLRSPSPSTEWVLTTSGTTSTPKLVSHTWDSLSATVRRQPGRGAGFVWGLLYDPCRFAGLQVVAQALAGGSPLVVGAAGDGWGARCASFASQGVNALSATPTLWRQLLFGQALDGLELRQITLGGEIADAAILSALQRRFPSARLCHVYASTEAGVGFSVTDGRPGFPSEWLSSPPAGLEVRLVADPSGARELHLRSARTSAAYVDGPPLRGEDDWVATGDLVDVQDDRVLFLGRLNGAVNVGGNKVFPEQVEQVLLDHPAVAAALVRARRSSLAGALVEACVVPRDPAVDSTTLKADLRQHCRVRLPPYAVPALVSVVSALDATSAGKQQRS